MYAVRYTLAKGSALSHPRARRVVGSLLPADARLTGTRKGGTLERREGIVRTEGYASTTLGERLSLLGVPESAACISARQPRLIVPIRVDYYGRNRNAIRGISLQFLVG